MEFGSVFLFKEKGKPKYLDRNLSEQGRQATTNSVFYSNSGHIGGCATLAFIIRRLTRQNVDFKHLYQVFKLTIYGALVIAFIEQEL